jgi:hypothetical protein
MFEFITLDFNLNIISDIHACLLFEIILLESFYSIVVIIIQ